MSNPSLLLIPDRYKAAKLYSQLPESGAGDFVVTRSTTATRTNASGLLESVASGVPRLDYQGGGCPALLVEPAATNLLLRSEQFDNAYWTKTACSVTANTGIAPDGTTTMDTVTSSSAAAEVTRSGFSLVSGTSYTLSFFIQNINYLAGETIRIVLSNGIDSEVRAVFNIVAGTASVTSSGSNLTSGRAAVTQLANGIFRVSISATSATSSSSASCSFQMQVASRSLRAWGAQLETGSVATSYIQTVSTTQTRNADVISVSSVSGLIGQTQGTLYVEVVTRITAGPVVKRILNISDGTNANRIEISKTTTDNIAASVVVSNVAQSDISSASNQSGVLKIAFSYAVNDFALYMNGTQIGTDAIGLVPACSKINLGSRGSDDFQFNDRIRAAAIYKTRLSNAELAQLTTL